MKNLMVATIEELSDYIVGQINTECVLQKPFPACDFSIVDVDERPVSSEKLEELCDSACGWYGIKSIHTGFDDDNLTALSDYYGGGCASFFQFYDGISENEAKKAVAQAILRSLSVQETINRNMTLIVHILEVA